MASFFVGLKRVESGFLQAAAGPATGSSYRHGDAACLQFYLPAECLTIERLDQALREADRLTDNCLGYPAGALGEGDRLTSPREVELQHYEQGRDTCIQGHHSSEPLQ